jgi:hypothetical protein
MAVLMAFNLTACGDDDDDDVPASIVGTKWYHEQIGDGEIWAYTIFCFNQLGVKANVTYTTAGTTYEIGVWPSAVYIPYQRVETGLEEISVYYNSTRSYTNFNPDGTIIE